MNNKNKILVGCLALLLVLSVGYALFSETVTINGTATAKGDFDIEGICELITASNPAFDSSDSITKGGTGTCKVENGVIKTNSTLTKPGDIVWFRVFLENTGTIAAKLKTIDTPNNFDKNLTGPGDEIYYDSTYELVAGYFVENYSSAAMSDSFLENAGFVINPNDIVSIVIAHEWKDVTNQPQLPEDGVTMNYNIVAGFEQVTAN